MDELTRLLSQITNLLSDQDFKNELKAYKSAFQRLRLRLRNNIFIGQLKRVVSIVNKLNLNFQPTLLRSYSQQISNSTGKKLNQAIKALVKFLNQLITLLDNSIDVLLQVYCISERQFRIGHLTHHLIVIRTSISRLRVIFKALLVYSCDLLFVTYKHYRGDYDNLICRDEIKNVLIKHQCKPKAEMLADKPNKRKKVEDAQNFVMEEKIGKIIDRKTYLKGATS